MEHIKLKNRSVCEQKVKHTFLAVRVTVAVEATKYTRLCC